MPVSPWYQEFEFDLPASLLNDLVALFAEMEPNRALLIADNVRAVPDEQGVYHIYLDNELVYVGKTDSDSGLNKRLGRHAEKIRARHNLDPARVTFSAVRIFVFTAVDLEQLLIKHYQKEADSPLTWNNSGFGSNDPGRERDTTKLKEKHFDRAYPINIDIDFEYAPSGGVFSVAKVLEDLKKAVPYNIRVQNSGGNSKTPHPDIQAANVTLPAGTRTARKLLALVAGALGSEWQVTALPGYVIAYKESVAYSHGTVITP